MIRITKVYDLLFEIPSVLVWAALFEPKSENRALSVSSEKSGIGDADHIA